MRNVHDSVENLGRIWASIDELCSPLTEEQWKHPTALPGWSVQDNLSHLVDYESRALGRPGPEHTPTHLGHARNAIGRSSKPYMLAGGLPPILWRPYETRCGAT